MCETGHVEIVLIISVVLALLVGGLIVGLLDRRPAPPKGSYQGVRDADDPRPAPRHAAPGGSTAVIDLGGRRGRCSFLGGWIRSGPFW